MTSQKDKAAQGALGLAFEHAFGAHPKYPMLQAGKRLHDHLRRLGWSLSRSSPVLIPQFITQKIYEEHPTYGDFLQSLEKHKRAPVFFDGDSWTPRFQSFEAGKSYILISRPNPEYT